MLEEGTGRDRPIKREMENYGGWGWGEVGLASWRRRRWREFRSGVGEGGAEIWNMAESEGDWVAASLSCVALPPSG